MQTLETLGFTFIENIYTKEEIDEIIALIGSKSLDNTFGVRAFLLRHPDMQAKVFTDKLRSVIATIAPNCHKSIKSIYFDKPPSANWIVNWHQDLTINLKNRKEIPGYKNWRVKDDRTIVQPTLEMLESIFTIRIHLDDCTKENGALSVIEKSHQNGVIEIKEWMKEKPGQTRICEVPKGGILVMKPLTLHSSRRTENQQSRRVIHVEFTAAELPDGLEWREKIEF